MADTLSLSVSEAMALLVKACRGAGLSWGEAQELSPCLLGRACDELEAALQALEAGDAPIVDEAIKPPHRWTIDRASFERLSALALKTYVPATETSRLAGAGAGTTDND